MASIPPVSAPQRDSAFPTLPSVGSEAVAATPTPPPAPLSDRPPALAAALERLDDAIRYHDQRVPKRLRRMEACADGAEWPEEPKTGAVEVEPIPFRPRLASSS